VTPFEFLDDLDICEN